MIFGFIITILEFGIIFPYIFPFSSKLISYYIIDVISLIMYIIITIWIIKLVIRKVSSLNTEYINDFEIFHLDESIAKYSYDRLIAFKDYSQPPTGIEKHTWAFILDEMIWFLDSIIESKYVKYSKFEYERFISAKRLFINHWTDLHIGRIYNDESE